MATEPLKFGPFTKGTNNVDKATALAADELLKAVNLDIDRNGRVSRRRGYTRVIAEDNTHSLWARDTSTAFYGSGLDLKMIKKDSAGNLTTSVLESGKMQLLKRIAFLELNGDVYYSNGIVRGMIRANDTAHDWGVEVPALNPVLAAGAGSLPAGRYLVGLTFLSDRGEESGMPAPQSITLAAQGGISVTSIPPGIHADVTTVRLHVSKADGEELYRYQEYPIGTTTALISGLAQLGGRSRAMFLEQMPPSTLLEYYRSMIYGVSGRVVWHTEPLGYGLCNVRKNFLLFAEDVGVFAAVHDGIYVGTPKRVYFYAGDGPGKFEPKIVLPYGAIPGTQVVLEKNEEGGSKAVGFFTERGFVKGLAGGAIQIGDKERIMIGQYSKGSAFYRETNGVRQVIGTMRGQTRTGFASADHAEAEVRRTNLNI